MALTALQQRFVDEYLIDLNGAAAAGRAGSRASNLRQAAHEFLTNPDVADAIAAAKQARSDETKVDAAYVLKRLHDENEADLADLYDENTGALLPVHKWPLIWRKGLIAGIDLEEIREDGAVVGVVRKVKISDRIKRTELIGKHVNVQAFKDQLDVKVTDDRAERLARARQRKAGDASAE